jgi:hypothetical protein
MTLPIMPYASYAQIFKDGELVETINLSALSETIEITLESGDSYNVIQAETGRVRISEANCFHGLCVRQGWRYSGVIPIVCLPNRVSVRLIGGIDWDENIDGVVG